MKCVANPHPLRFRRQRGYILALNILVLAMMLVGATYIGQRMSLARTLARAEQQRVEDDFALESARARALFLLATVPRGRDGLGSGIQAVALDGREYRLGDRVRVSFQDTRGQIGINATRLNGEGRERIERLLGSYGVDSIAAHALTDRLLDYRDSDDLRRIDGAERDDYRSIGRESFVRNDNLLTPAELGRVFSWADYPQLWGEDPLSGHVHAETLEPFNPNTANWRALSAAAGIPAEVAKSLIERRRRGEIPDIARLAFGSGVDDPFVLGTTVVRNPGPAILVTLRVDDASWGYRMLVTHTPISRASPWHVGYAQKIALPPSSVPADRIPSLPEATALRDFDAKDRIELPF